MTLLSVILDLQAHSRRAAYACLLMGLAVGGCALAGTPRAEDSLALQEYYNRVKSPRAAQTSCSLHVELLRSTSEATRPYDELATLSATCYPGTPSLCEERLTTRTCELGGDAIIVVQPTAGGTPPGSSGQSQISMSGRAIRWRSSPPRQSEASGGRTN